MKRCRKCGQVKARSEFYVAKAGADGLRGECKACFGAMQRARYQADPEAAKARTKKWQQENKERLNAYRREYRKGRRLADREAHLMRKFGITQADYDAMLEAQGGGCAICGKPPSDKASLHVDHDHATGRVRGLLCVGCNNGLGQFGDGEGLLRDAIGYITMDAELDPLIRERAYALVT